MSEWQEDRLLLSFVFLKPGSKFQGFRHYKTKSIKLRLITNLCDNNYYYDYYLILLYFFINFAVVAW